MTFLAVLGAVAAFSQNDLKGQVLLKGNGEPLPGILLELGGQNAFSDAQGLFSLEMPAAQGKGSLRASCTGFEAVTLEIDAATAPFTELRIEMAEKVMGLPDVLVESVSLTGGLRGLRNIPGSAAYLSPKELERFSYTDINRTLRAVPGVNLQEEDGFGLRPNIGLRGTGSERSSKITVMEDEVLAAPAPYASPAAYYFPTIGRMQAVEILKGSSQVRFGPFTTGGAINLISTPVPESFSGKLHLLGGSFGSRNLLASVGNSHRNFGYLAETFQYKSDGFKQLDGGGDTGFDKKDYLLKFMLRTGPKAKIQQSLGLKLGQSTEKSNETYLGLSQADFEADPYRRYAASQQDRMDTEQKQYSLRHNVQFSSSLALSTTAYRQDFHRNWYKLDKVKESGGSAPDIYALLLEPEAFPEAFATLQGESSPIENALAVKANNRRYRSEGVQSVLNWRFQTGALRHSLDLGLRLHRDEMDRFQWADEYAMSNGRMLLTKPGEPGTESNRIESAKALASYAQLKMQWNNWTLVPGIRHERIRLQRQDYGKADPERLGTELATIENEATVFIPGAGLYFKASPMLDLFAGAHKGFSPPGVKEGSRAEESVNYELGSRWRQGRLSGTAVLFLNDYENLLGADLAAGGGGGSNDLFNGGQAVSKGLEFQATWELLGADAAGWNLPLSLVYTYTDASFQSSFSSEFEGWGQVQSGDELPYLAKHQLTFLASLSHAKFSFNLSGRYQGDMRSVAGQGEMAELERVPGFFIVDASATYQLHPQASLFANVSNLSDEVALVSRHPAGLRPALPRSFMAGVRVDF